MGTSDRTANGALRLVHDDQSIALTAASWASPGCRWQSTRRRGRNLGGGAHRAHAILTLGAGIAAGAAVEEISLRKRAEPAADDLTGRARRTTGETDISLADLARRAGDAAGATVRVIVAGIGAGTKAIR